MERNYLAFQGNGFSFKKDAFRKVVEPIGEAKHDYDIYAAISKKLDEIDPRYNHDRLLNPDETLYWAGQRGSLWETNTVDEERDRWFRETQGCTWEDILEARKHEYPAEAVSMGFERWEIPGKWPTGCGKAELFSTLYQHLEYPTAPVYTELEVKSIVPHEGFGSSMRLPPGPAAAARLSTSHPSPLPV